jgi:hypothetical protein
LTNTSGPISNGSGYWKYGTGTNQQTRSLQSTAIYQKSIKEQADNVQKENVRQEESKRPVCLQGKGRLENRQTPQKKIGTPRYSNSEPKMVHFMIINKIAVFGSESKAGSSGPAAAPELDREDE